MLPAGCSGRHSGRLGQTECILFEFQSAHKFEGISNGIDQIGDVQFDDGYYVFSFENSTTTINGDPVDLYSTITLSPYMVNVVSYLPEENRSVEEVFGQIHNSILLVSNDEGQYYVPDFGINHIDQVGGMSSGE